MAEAAKTITSLLTVKTGHTEMTVRTTSAYQSGDTFLRLTLTVLILSFSTFDIVSAREAADAETSKY